ncbi:MAG: putative baseplate assembly protein, partial [Gemmatimonadaceae bacterium]
MSATLALVCKDDSKRRALVRGAQLNGFDYVEVSDDQTHLTIYFLGKAPAWEVTKEHLRIKGGRRIRGITVTAAHTERSDRDDVDDCLKVTVDRAGDASMYEVCIVDLDQQGRPLSVPPRDFDPRYACACFSFKASCPSELDCLAPVVCDEPALPVPAIDYLAKDYASFRRLILDRLALVMPEWRERHIPDLGITLVELLAYVGDHLSYYQDAVATEAYLDTARLRISVRRHVRLVDYRLHEGSNARTWMT